MQNQPRRKAADMRHQVMPPTSTGPTIRVPLKSWVKAQKERDERVKLALVAPVPCRGRRRRSTKGGQQSRTTHRMINSISSPLRRV